MDSVRFGRVLGIGTRLAAKTVAAAVDAATAPNPAAGKTAANTTGAKAGQAAAHAAVKGAGQVKSAGAKAKVTASGLKRGGKRFGEAVWGPFAKAGGVLWLEFTGVFFGIFALAAGLEVWKRRAAWHVTGVNHEEHVRLLVVGAMTVVFGYFFVSSFVRAGRKSKGK